MAALKANAVNSAVAPQRALRTTHVITSLEEGGAQGMLLKLLALQRGSADTSRVVTLVDEGSIRPRLEALGVRVDGLHMKRGRPSAAAALRLTRLLRAERPDLVQTWLYHADLLGGLAARALRIPVVWGIRNDALLCEETLLTRLTQRACAALSWRVPERIICNSEAARRTHAAAGFAPDKLVVVPNGFDVSVFQPSAEARSAIRAELGIPESSPLVGMVARHHPHKDHATFFTAAAAIKRELPAATFLLCGEDVGWDSPALVRMVDAAGLRGAVHLLGKRADVARVTAALDVACLISHTESFPNVIGEAMACGVPCVATDCGDVREILGGLGRVVPVGDAEAVAGGVLEILNMNPAGREQLARSARARVSAHYDARVVAARFREIHAQVIR